jgi:L-threonylcarbamoyladenylate synthase
MSRVVSVAEHGPAAARAALEAAISAGEVVLFPADGLYGLACDPLRADAIERIGALKGRDEDKPSAVLYFSPLAMRELLASLGPRTREALAALLPGPVTLVVANPERRYPLACGQHPERLGVRLIEGALAGAMCPILQTSANRAGGPAPASFEEVEPRIRQAVALAIDGGRLSGMPSTVVDISAIERGAEPAVLRAGALGDETVRKRLATALEDRK